jgi:ribosomal protein L25 (general stress protein Ctc)
MCERRNTIVCSFDPASRRISATDIHEWIHMQLQVEENTVQMIQIDETSRQVFIKFIEYSQMQDIMTRTNSTT